MYTNNAYQRGAIFTRIVMASVLVVIVSTVIVAYLNMDNNLLLGFILYKAIPTIVTVGLIWVLWPRTGYYISLIVAVLLALSFWQSIKINIPDQSIWLSIMFAYIILMFSAVGILFKLYGSKILYLTFSKIKFIF